MQNFTTFNGEIIIDSDLAVVYPVFLDRKLSFTERISKLVPNFKRKLNTVTIRLSPMGKKIKEEKLAATNVVQMIKRRPYIMRSLYRKNVMTFLLVYAGQKNLDKDNFLHSIGRLGEYSYGNINMTKFYFPIEESIIPDSILEETVLKILEGIKRYPLRVVFWSSSDKRLNKIKDIAKKHNIR